eukprot:gb/GEZN01000893.1/.p1 GENE.gb/GEZN01000893.1/~~gb/GEZN01000893.1/.p1  ORF type:complete len:942 (-),score=162.24 gb/GEZN01000893.1/:94-2919(-)
MSGFDYHPLQEGTAESTILLPLKTALGLVGMGLVGAAGWAARQSAHLRWNGTGPERNVVFAEGLSSVSASAPPFSAFVPEQGIDAVLARPGPPGTLQVLPAVPASSSCSCLFLYVQSLAKGGESSEGWVFGAQLGPDRDKPLAILTGHHGDVLKGRVLCWPLESFSEHLKAADSLNCFDPTTPTKGTTRRGLVQVVGENGRTKQAFWYYQDQAHWPFATPPMAVKKPHKIKQHGESRIDYYAWLRDDDWQEVLQDPSKLKTNIRRHLEAENAYYETMMAEQEGLRETLVAEMRARVKEDEASVPMQDGPYFYSVKYRKGGQYPIFVRTPVGKPKEEEVLFDGDEESKGQAFFDIGGMGHSNDHTMILYGLDTVGSEDYTLRVRMIASKQELPLDVIGKTCGDGVWSKDSKSFFYVELDSNTRPQRVKRHILGTDPKNDFLVYEEKDDGFAVDVSDSESGEFLLVFSENEVENEVFMIPADHPESLPLLIAPKIEGQLYEPHHHGDQFFILTNADGAVDFKVVVAPVSSPGRENWKDLIPHKPGVFITQLITYKNYHVRQEMYDALPRIIISTYGGEEHAVNFQEAAFALDVAPGYEYDTEITYFTYESPTTPAQIYDYDMGRRNRTLLRTQVVPSGHDPNLYEVTRINAPAEDGALIPVTVLRLKSLSVGGHAKNTDTPGEAANKCGQTAPLLLSGYGSYGESIAADFSTTILSLVDRGVVHAVAHVRGGAERGRSWYFDGKLTKKMNTFKDLNAAALALIGYGYTSKKQIVTYGGSAGGLLVGAALNMRPDLYAGVIADVPFVDVLNTMSDEELPLTPAEWPEWGNPIQDRQAYHLIKGYAPYENIHTGVAYPPILATGGIADARVTYWEPAKWVARLRAEGKGGPFLLKMNLEAGHGGSTGRFTGMKEDAHIYAFALRVLGLSDAKPIYQPPHKWANKK